MRAPSETMQCLQTIQSHLIEIARDEPLPRHSLARSNTGRGPQLTPYMRRVEVTIMSVTW